MSDSSEALEGRSPTMRLGSALERLDRARELRRQRVKVLERGNVVRTVSGAPTTRFSR
jgi:hypothetical protein